MLILFSCSIDLMHVLLIKEGGVVFPVGIFEHTSSSNFQDLYTYTTDPPTPFLDEVAVYGLFTPSLQNKENKSFG